MTELTVTTETEYLPRYAVDFTLIPDIYEDI